MSISQSGFTPAVTHCLDEQSQHIAYLTSQLKSRGIRKIEPSQEAEDGWTKTIIESAQMQRGFISECTPGFYNMEGEISDKFLRNSSYGLGSPAFFKMLDEWRKEGQLRGLELEYEDARAPASAELVTNEI
jgi:cyclohexanone monooxygenase